MLYFLNHHAANTGRPALKVIPGTHLSNPDEILRLEAVSNYTRIYLANGKKMLISKTLKHFCEQLLPAGFIRCHRTHLVNPGYVQKIVPGALRLKNGETIVISRRKKKEINLSALVTMMEPHARLSVSV